MANTMKTLFSTTHNNGRITTHYEIVENKERKFKIYLYIDTSSDCVGFNRNCCLSVMTADGTFAEVVDNRSIGLAIDRYHPSSAIDTAVKGFKDFIKKVY